MFNYTPLNLDAIQNAPPAKPRGHLSFILLIIAVITVVVFAVLIFVLIQRRQQSEVVVPPPPVPVIEEIPTPTVVVIEEVTPTQEEGILQEAPIEDISVPEGETPPG